MAGGGVSRPWEIEVGVPDVAGAMSGFGRSYWPTLMSVALMLVALVLTVQAHRRSAELAEMQTDFVAHVSHQLKTPLSLLSAATETLQMDRIRSPEKLSEYLDTIRAEVARLSTLVQRVLEFSRVQQDRSYELEHVDFGALTRETVDAFAHGLAGHHFTFDVRHRRARARTFTSTPRRSNKCWPTCSITPSSTRTPSRRSPCACAPNASSRSSRSPIAASASPRPISDRIFERFYRASSARGIGRDSAWGCRSCASWSRPTAAASK